MAKRAFLKAIRLELAGLQEQLQASLREVNAGRRRFEADIGAPPQLAGTLRTTVFSTQLGKLRDVSDPLVIEIIRLYSDIPVLEQVLDLLNKQASEYSKVQGVQRQILRDQILSATQVLIESLAGFLHRIRDLLSKLQAEK